MHRSRPRRSRGRHRRPGSRGASPAPAREPAGRYSNRLIRISGHSDSDPIKKSQWKTNERLSAERALTVEEYLANKGVSNDSMYVAAFGSSRPLETKKSSRRVEIVVLNVPSD